MQRWKAPSRCLWLVATPVLVCLLAPGVAQAEEPMLAIRQVGGDSSVYAIAEVTRLGFEGDSLVVVSSYGPDRFSNDEIEKIEFLWGFSGVGDPDEIVAAFKAIHLFQNQPNPFSPETRIDFELPTAGPVELAIYEVNGRQIRSLLKEERAAGPHTVRWDGRDDDGREVPSGVYFYNLTASGLQESRQMILLP
ncbi:MAG: T9SS type A sorting domain-containing protein [Candidatus Eisenbacteria sp.]|nr:T9SS type A sorting domain-containing protein [Candidatus Eisenbacteria bacterium]